MRSPCTVFGDPITSDNQRWLTCVKLSDIADTFWIILAVLDGSAWTYPLRNIVLYLVITEDQGLYQEMLYLKQTDMKQVNLDLDAMAPKACFEKQGGITVCEQLNSYTFSYFFVFGPPGGKEYYHNN